MASPYLGHTKANPSLIPFICVLIFLNPHKEHRSGINFSALGGEGRLHRDVIGVQSLGGRIDGCQVEKGKRAF